MQNCAACDSPYRCQAWVKVPGPVAKEGLGRGGGAKGGLGGARGVGKGRRELIIAGALGMSSLSQLLHDPGNDIQTQTVYYKYQYTTLAEYANKCCYQWIVYLHRSSVDVTAL